MRSSNGWHLALSRELTDVWPQDLGGFPPAAMLAVELGLYLLGRVMPGRPARDAWTLFGGYPYAEASGHVRTDEPRLAIRRARHYLWTMRRRRVWLTHLERYLTLPPELRGYLLAGLDEVPAPRSPARAAGRFEKFEDLLTSPPEFTRRRIPLATAGQYLFPVRDRRYSVTFSPALADGPRPSAHDLAAGAAGQGEAVTVTWENLQGAATEMDRNEASLPPAQQGDWASRLGRVKLLIRQQGGFKENVPLSINGLLHLVGMVGAGKSTLRDILTYWYVTRDTGRKRRVTIVVGDVAETLAVVGTFSRLGIAAAPVLGQTTRERNIQRLHRRLATAGAPAMIAHEHPGFRYLSSACAVDSLRGLEADRPLRIGEAPCTMLFRADGTEAGEATGTARDRAMAEAGGDAGGGGRRPQREGCPLWSRCPRHHGARDLVTAQVWVATPASLVHSAVPPHQADARIRYLELACRMSDLIIVDEADRVQMQLDAMFAPSATLVGRSPDSWLDEVQAHKITELARQGRLQLSAQEIDDWTNAVNTVSVAADRLYALLIKSKPLRDWVVADYFSPFTLHQRLLGAWFPEIHEAEASGRLDAPEVVAVIAERDRISAILDAVRDDPLQPREAGGNPAGPSGGDLVRLTLELLHAHTGATTRLRLRRVLLELVPEASRPRIEADLGMHALRFEFTLILAALHHRLDYVTGMWPVVEAVLNLDFTSNVLSRRPPRDYEPFIPESPMGNVLGFQFQLDEGGQSGSLRFFRCSGVGRELLLGLNSMPSVDGRPGPNVLLMSATSWAGTSSRYHVHVPVGAVLRPHDNEVKAILGTTFRKEFLYGPDGQALRLSGSGVRDRPDVLRQMLRQLAEPDRSLAGAASKLADELAELAKIDPDRCRILILTGSYAEARDAADYLNGLAEWNGRITALISDDADFDDAWAAMPGDKAAGRLRRGDVASFAATTSEILVAPLLAVERGHNIVLPGGKAAIGTVYFLARPHPRPDDITLAIQAVNDWAVRYVRDGGFAQQVRAVGSLDAAGLAFRQRAREKWQRYLTRRLAWSSLPLEEKVSFTWDQLVVMWQVIGRLVRGGAPARVVFVDAAFAPREAGLTATDTPDTSLLLSMRQVLAPYFTDESGVDPTERSLVENLYDPLYQALVGLG
ncbi:MAG TPA: signal recognition particle [Streptosporangiaceae bacterium]|nr:signal recognition particle [Streptosporangiaceae bacterium]